MKIFVSIIFVLLIFVGQSFANLYVIYDGTTKEVYSASEKNDTIVPEGKTLETFQGSFKDYDFQYNPIYYKIDKKKFIVNTEKISADTVAQEQNQVLEEFDVKKVKGELFDAFEKDLQTFSVIYTFVGDLLEYKDFDRLKRLSDDLLNSGVITKEIFEKFSTILKNNGIDVGEGK